MLAFTEERSVQNAEILINDFQWAQATVKKVLLREPRILGLNKDTITNRIQWMTYTWCQNDTKAGEILIKRNPALLATGRNAENIFLPKMKMMENRLGLNTTKVTKIIRAMPLILTCNFNTTIEPKLTWLEETFDLNQADLARVIQRRPSLLIGFGVNETLVPKTLWLQQRLHLDDTTLRKIVKLCPAILTFSSDKIEPCLQWLQQELALDDPLALRKFVAGAPCTLGMNTTNNLQPKLDFYKQCLGDEEGSSLVRNNPVLLAVSLEKRLKPRLQEAIKAGIKVDYSEMYKIGMHTPARWQNYIEGQR